VPRGNPKGNPNPSPSTRFKPGQIANPRGKTSEQRQLEISNAWLATQLRAQMLQELVATVKDNPAAILARIEPATLKLIKDAEDRGLGTPKASVDITNSDASLKPEPRDIVEALRRKYAEKASA
jgi:hypothetical protein